MRLGPTSPIFLSRADFGSKCPLWVISGLVEAKTVMANSLTPITLYRALRNPAP